MPERDYIGDVLEVGYTGVFDLDGLYRLFNQWFKRHSYTFRELDYKESREEGAKKLAVKWEAKRTVTDYVRYAMGVSCTVTNLTEVMVKNRRRVSGSLTLKLATYLEKDYEETWSRRALLKFLRESYDRYVAGSKLKEMQEELRGEMNALRDDVKTFLNMQKIGK